MFMDVLAGGDGRERCIEISTAVVSVCRRIEANVGVTECGAAVGG
jgi:hypothetical protein